MAGGGYGGKGGGTDSLSGMGDQHPNLPVGCRRRDGHGLAGQRQVLPEHPLEVVDHRSRDEDVDVVVQ